MDHAIVVVVTDDSEHVKVFIDIVPANTMTAALDMVLPCARLVICKYALLCTRLAMAFKHALEEGIVKRVNAYRAYNRQHTGVAWPLPVCIHPVMKLHALDVFVMTVLEFLPATT